MVADQKTRSGQTAATRPATGPALGPKNDCASQKHSTTTIVPKVALAILNASASTLWTSIEIVVVSPRYPLPPR